MLIRANCISWSVPNAVSAGSLPSIHFLVHHTVTKTTAVCVLARDFGRDAFKDSPSYLNMSYETESYIDSCYRLYPNPKSRRAMYSLRRCRPLFVDNLQRLENESTPWLSSAWIPCPPAVKRVEASERVDGRWQPKVCKSAGLDTGVGSPDLASDGVLNFHEQNPLYFLHTQKLTDRVLTLVLAKESRHIMLRLLPLLTVALRFNMYIQAEECRSHGHWGIPLTAECDW